MPLINMNNILDDARKNKYAVGAFNVVNHLSAQAVVNAAESLNVPVILQTSVKTVVQIGVNAMIDFLIPLAKRSSVDVCIHLDHCQSVDLTKECIDAGWPSVMIDGSKYELETNIDMTKQVVKHAKGRDITVEGELGAIVGVEDDIVVNEDESTNAKPNDCRIYLRETGVDAFAPAIGTAHGLYKGVPKINYDLFSEINSFSHVPLVLHGGTGLSDDTFIELIKRGAAKVNISTALKIAYCQGIKDYTTANPNENNPLKVDAFAMDEIIKMVVRHIKLFNK